MSHPDYRDCKLYLYLPGNLYGEVGVIAYVNIMRVGIPDIVVRKTPTDT